MTAKDMVTVLESFGVQFLPPGTESDPDKGVFASIAEANEFYLKLKKAAEDDPPAADPVTPPRA